MESEDLGGDMAHHAQHGHHDHRHVHHDHPHDHQHAHAASMGLDPSALSRREVHRIDRRRFLTDLGRNTFAVAIVGGFVAACGGDDDTAGTSPEDEPAQTYPPDDVTSGEVPSDRLAWTQVPLGSVSAYVLTRGNTAAVVDTGNPGNANAIGETLAMLGLTYDDVGHVVLTHHHPDHIGSLPDVMAGAAAATAYAGALDIPNIAGAEITAVGDGDDVFGLQVIATPGHTPGSISLFDPGIGLLVAGDALRGNDDGTAVLGPDERYTSDMDTAVESVAKLALLDVQAAGFGHGQPVSEGAGALIRALT